MERQLVVGAIKEQSRAEDTPAQNSNSATDGHMLAVQLHSGSRAFMNEAGISVAIDSSPQWTV